MEFSFSNFGISEFLLERIRERNITEATQIQKEVIPLLLNGENLIFSSATGTGKTLAYLLPVLEIILKKEKVRGPRCLVIAPTHELCSQIKKEADFLLEALGRKTALLIGQSSSSRQKETLKKDKPLLAAGNPSRLLALAKEKKLRLDFLEFLVLDEGDRLVSEELAKDTEELTGLIKRQCKSTGEDEKLKFISCSATFSSKNLEKLRLLAGEKKPESSKTFAQIGKSAPNDEELSGRHTVKFIKLEENILKSQIEHWAFYSENRDKIGTLRAFVNAVSKTGKKPERKKILVFIAAGRQIENIVSKLQHYQLNAEGLWGGMDKSSRKKVFDNFHRGNLQILVTSDLAARGLDIPDIAYIVSLDTNENADIYSHRAGRTARAGKTGVMATIGNETELRRLAILEKKLKIKVYPKELFNGKIVSPSAVDPDAD